VYKKSLIGFEICEKKNKKQTILQNNEKNTKILRHRVLGRDFSKNKLEMLPFQDGNPSFSNKILLNLQKRAHANLSGPH
tara:strand:- start:157 stop:393 length:237 start_codon:yes stop_codon:yes gene_type:complete